MEKALQVLNDRYVSKLIKKMCTKNLLTVMNGQTHSAITDTKLNFSGDSDSYGSRFLAEANLSSGSYSTRTESNLHGSSNMYALEGTS